MTRAKSTPVTLAASVIGALYGFKSVSVAMETSVMSVGAAFECSGPVENEGPEVAEVSKTFGDSRVGRNSGESRYANFWLDQSKNCLEPNNVAQR